ncbi:MAG: fatty-acyl-CoA synthase, partial [Baekduia sp.]|nr:fatty-acyl-CoA synthase [Baekduia sp.]
GEDELKAYIKENLASYKVPREIVFLDELPRNATGKVLKRELVESSPGGRFSRPWHHRPWHDGCYGTTTAAPSSAPDRRSSSASCARSSG